MFWIHIGCPRTGTTALQTFLFENAATLNASGLAYLPGASSRDLNANRLVVAARNGNLPRMQRILRSGLQKRDLSTVTDAVFSSELLYQAPVEHCLHALQIAEMPKRRVVVYLRRQDLLLESLARQMKITRARNDIVGYAKRRMDWVDHRRAIEIWLEHGIEVIPRICEPAALCGGSSVQDFLSLFNRPFEIDFSAAARRSVNESPSLKALQLQQVLAEAGAPLLDNTALRDLSRQLGSDAIPTVFPDAFRKEILDRHAAGNEWIRERYFPDRPSLFEASTERFEPERLALATFSPEEMQALRTVIAHTKDAAV